MLVNNPEKLEEKTEKNWEAPEVRAEILPEALKAATAFSSHTCLVNGAFGDGTPVPDSVHDRIYGDL